jgi:endonuclease/exonuclease/phosphatase family metal-dependent hydrolase
LCTQEIWLADVEEFFDGLPHVHKVRDPNASTFWPPTIGGSGLGVASRFPIVTSQTRAFGGRKVHAERLARKGMLHARVRVAEGIEADLVSTHMQAGYTPDAARVREDQLAQLRAFADEVGSPERPLIVCGDFNVCGLSAVRHEEYVNVQKHFHGFEDLFMEEDAPTFRPHPEGNALAFRFEPKAPMQRLDYVLFRPPAPGAGVETIVHERRIMLHERLPPHGGEAETDSSDHDALTIVLRSRR